MFVGRWITLDAISSGVPHMWILPCLFLTLMAGPAGLLSYLSLKTLYLATEKKTAQAAARRENKAKDTKKSE